MIIYKVNTGKKGEMFFMFFLLKKNLFWIKIFLFISCIYVIFSKNCKKIKTFFCQNQAKKMEFQISKIRFLKYLLSFNQITQ